MSGSSLISTRPTIKVDGEAQSEMQEALTGMVINLPLSGTANGELILTNWGRVRNGTETSFAFQDIGLGQTIEIIMGENDDKQIFKGEITALEERYGNGAPQLVILAQDKLHLLARKRQSKTYDDKSPDDVVRSIASDAGLQADVNVSSVTSTFHQINESNLAFLTRVLTYFDIAVRLDGDKLRARPEETDPDPIELSAQDSARELRLIADLNHQHGNTKVMGFNPATDEPVDHEVTALSSPPGGTTAYDTLGQLGWPAEEVVGQPFAASQGHADAFSLGHFTRQAKRFISGEIRCQGEPTLRSGREIDLSGVSDRMAGIYRVVHCVHRFDAISGHETHLRVNKAGWQV
jgi:phage protein D